MGAPIRLICPLLTAISTGLIPSPAMGRVERRLFRINDEIARLREELRLTEEELRIHQHLDDDARRDAAVGGPIEREDARTTSSDVDRAQKVIATLRDRIERLEQQRAQLLDRLD